MAEFRTVLGRLLYTKGKCLCSWICAAFVMMSHCFVSDSVGFCLPNFSFPSPWDSTTTSCPFSGNCPFSLHSKPVTSPKDVKALRHDPASCSSSPVAQGWPDPGQSEFFHHYLKTWKLRDARLSFLSGWSSHQVRCPPGTMAKQG